MPGNSIKDTNDNELVNDLKNVRSYITANR